MTITQFLQTLEPVDDMSYRICIMDFSVGELEKFEYDGEDNWVEFIESIPGGERDLKKLSLPQRMTMALSCRSCLDERTAQMQFFFLRVLFSTLVDYVLLYFF